MPAWVDPELVEQRIVEQATRLPPPGAVTGWASLRLHGGTFFDGLAQGGRVRRPVPLNPGPMHKLTEDEHCTVSRDRVFPPEIRTVLGVRCTIEERALFDEMRYAVDWRSAVVAMDMAAAAEISSRSLMHAYVLAHPAWTGVEQVRRALPLASEDSHSPPETHMRLVWVVDAGLPVPLCNRPVFTTGGEYVGRPDLLDIEAGVVGEFDGAEHRELRRHVRDVAREDAFRRLGLEYFTITGPDLGDVGRVVERMLATRRRARFLAPAERAWTVAPPPWFRPVPSLDERISRRRGLL